MSSFWRPQNFEPLYGWQASAGFSHPMSLAAAVAVKFLSRLLFVDFIPLLYYFPLSPHYWALDFFSSSCKKRSKNGSFFWLVTFSEARGDVSPPPASSRLVRRGAARSCFCRRLLPASSRAAPSVHRPADLAGLVGRRPNAKSVLLSKVYFLSKVCFKSVFLNVYTSASGSKCRRRSNDKSNCCRYLM